MAGDPAIVSLLLERGADPNRGNDYGWTKLHQAGYSNDSDLATLMLGAGAAHRSLRSRRRRHTARRRAVLGSSGGRRAARTRQPSNLRVAAGLGDLELIRRARRHAPGRGAPGILPPSRRLPAWRPSDDPQEVLDEALVWAAKADRAEAIRPLVVLGAALKPTPTAARRSHGRRRTAASPRSDPRPARRRPKPARHLRRADPRRRRHRAPPCRQSDSAKQSSRFSTSKPIRWSPTTCTAAPRSTGPASVVTPTSQTSCPEREPATARGSIASPSTKRCPAPV